MGPLLGKASKFRDGGLAILKSVALQALEGLAGLEGRDPRLFLWGTTEHQSKAPDHVLSEVSRKSKERYLRSVDSLSPGQGTQAS